MLNNCLLYGCKMDELKNLWCSMWSMAQLRKGCMWDELEKWIHTNLLCCKGSAIVELEFKTKVRNVDENWKYWESGSMRYWRKHTFQRTSGKLSVFYLSKYKSVLKYFTQVDEQCAWNTGAVYIRDDNNPMACTSKEVERLFGLLIFIGMFEANN